MLENLKQFERNHPSDKALRLLRDFKKTENQYDKAKLAYEKACRETESAILNLNQVKADPHNLTEKEASEDRVTEAVRLMEERKDVYSKSVEAVNEK